MIALYFLMLFVFFSYVGFVIFKYGIQDSISESYYCLPKKYKFIFTLFCWGFAVPAIIIGSTALMFFAGVGILFVGTAAAFKEKMTYEVHMTGAILSICCSQISLFIDFGIYYLLPIFVISSLIILLLRKKITKYFWWIELLAFGITIIGIGIKLF